jgi:hypothetical protein
MTTLLETSAVALAGMTVLALLAQPGPVRNSCPISPPADVVWQAAPVVTRPVQDRLLRDMLLHD